MTSQGPAAVENGRVSSSTTPRPLRGTPRYRNWQGSPHRPISGFSPGGPRTLVDRPAQRKRHHLESEEQVQSTVRGVSLLMKGPGRATCRRPWDVPDDSEYSRLQMDIQTAIGESRIHKEGADPSNPNLALDPLIEVDDRIDAASLEHLIRLGHHVARRRESATQSFFAKPLGVASDESGLSDGLDVFRRSIALGV